MFGRRRAICSPPGRSMSSWPPRVDSTRHRPNSAAPSSPTLEEITMTPVSQTSSDRSSTTSLDRAKQLATTLLSERSQASGAKAARLLHKLLGTLDAGDRHAFQHYLATEFQPDGAALRSAAQRYLADGTAEAAAALARAADPPRQELLRRINMAPGGIGALIAMRSEIASCLRAEPELKLLDADLKHLFAS